MIKYFVKKLQNEKNRETIFYYVCAGYHYIYYGDLDYF